MLLTKLVFTVICISVLIVLAQVFYYILYDKNFTKNNTTLVQCSAAIVAGSATGGMLKFIYDFLTYLWLH
ncbi:hypothetical protein TaPaz_178 [Acinetobacter phage TaPaz]|nr:hypothetical protein TaPaz_178 [Acinetobacter phage TaPaz]